MSETDENFQVTEGKDYTAQIKSQQEESAAIIKEHLIQHNENKKNPAYLVGGGGTDVQPGKQ